MKIRCEECDEKLTQKIDCRRIHSFKHKKNERLYNRNKIIEDANEKGKKLLIKRSNKSWTSSIHN